MYLNFDSYLSPLSMDPRGAYFDVGEDGGTEGGGRKRSPSTREEEEDEEARASGSLPEKRIKVDVVPDDHSWSSRYPSTSHSIPSNSYDASSSSRSSRLLSTSSFSTVGSPQQDRYRPSQYLATSQLPSSLLSDPPLTCSFTQPNTYSTSEDNSFGLSFSTQVDPFGLGGSGADWWELDEDEAEGTPVVESTMLVGLVVDRKADVAGSSLGWNEGLGWSELTSSPVSQQPFLDYSYPSSPSDQLATSPNQTQAQVHPYHPSPPTSHHQHLAQTSPTSQFLTPPYSPPHPCPVPSHQTRRPRNFYQERVAALNARGARPSFIALPAGSSSSYSSGSNSGEDFASALGRIRREKGPFKLVFPTMRRTPSPPALA